MPGDIDSASALASARLHFGDIPPGPPITVRDDWQVNRTFNTSQLIEDRVDNERIVRGWVAPGREYSDIVHLQLGRFDPWR